MKTNLLSLEDVKLLRTALDHLAEEVRGSGESAGEVRKALGKISDLKGKLEEGGLCEAGAEEICASTRIGVFW